MALPTAGESVDRQACAVLFQNIGIDSNMLSDAVFKVYDPSGDGMVPSRAIVCGISLLCASKATAQEKLAFTFQIFDVNRNSVLEKAEIEEFFTMLRGPINTIIESSLRNFYETCGYEEDFREDISALTVRSLDDHIAGIVAD